MPSTTNSDRIRSLEDSAAEYRTRIATLEALVAPLVTGLADMRQEFAVAKHRLAELEKDRERQAGRIWATVGPILGAIVGATATYFLRR